MLRRRRRPAWTPGHLRFSVGALDCVAVSDGALVCGPPDDPPPAAVLFANAPPAEVDAAVEEAGETLPWMEWTEQITCLLIDTGAAADPDRRRRRRSRSRDGKPHREPRRRGLCTHRHRRRDRLARPSRPHRRARRWQRFAAFPAARVLLSRKEWRFWMEGEAERVLPVETAAFLIEFAHQTLPALRHRLELVDEEGDLPGGVRFLPTPGHTPGHLAIELSSRNERLLVVGDAVLHPLHVEHPGVALSGRLRASPPPADPAEALRHGRPRGLPRARVPLPLPRTGNVERR